MRKTLLALALAALAVRAHAAPLFDQWNGAGPFATGLDNQGIDSLAVSADGMRVAVGTGSGTVLVYPYADVTAPVASDLGISGIAQTAATLAATSSETATGYWIVVPRDASAPSAAAVKAGSAYAGVTVVAHGSGAMAAGAATSFAIAGLTANTAYDLYFVAADTAGNLPAAPTKLQFATAAAAAPASNSGAPEPSLIVVPTGGTAVLTTLTPVQAASGSTLVIPANANVAGVSIRLTGGDGAGTVTFKIGNLSFTLHGYAPGTTVGFKKVPVNGVDTLVLVVASGSLQLSGAAGQPLLTIDGAYTLTAGADGAAIRFSSAASGDGSGSIAVTGGYILLSAAAFATEAADGGARALPANGKVFAGEIAAFDAAGKITAIKLGSPSADGGGVGDPLALDLAANLEFAVPIPRLDGYAARLGGDLQDAIAAVAGARLAGGQSGGILALDVGGDRLHALPMGDITVDTRRADGIKVGADGTATVTTGGLVVRFAPGVADLGRLAADVAALDGRLTVADGVLRAVIGATTFVLQPGWEAPTGTSEGFGSAAGQLTYGQLGRIFTFHPAFADHERLLAVVQTALPGATASANGDGTVTLELAGRYWRLRPAATLETAPPGELSWWVGADGMPKLRYPDGTMQGFGIE